MRILDLLSANTKLEGKSSLMKEESVDFLTLCGKCLQGVRLSSLHCALGTCTA